MALVAALRAAALAIGGGVPPDEVWQMMTRAVVGADVPNLAQLLADLPSTRLAGYLAAEDTPDGPQYYLERRLAAVLDGQPETVWSMVDQQLEANAHGLAPDAPLLDPPDVVHRRITRTFVEELVAEGIIVPDAPPPIDEPEDPDDFLQWLRSVAISPRRPAYDRRNAADQLHRSGATTEAVNAFAAIVADQDGKLWDRYQAAWDLWRLQEHAAALRAYRLLAEDPEANQNAMRGAIDDITAGAAPPDGSRVPGIGGSPPPLGAGTPPLPL